MQAPGRILTGLEAVTVRTCPEAKQATTTRLVHIDADNLGGLESAWTWSQAGQHQVCDLLCVSSFAALSALCSLASEGLLLAQRLTVCAMSQSARPLFQARLKPRHKVWQHVH